MRYPLFFENSSDLIRQFGEIRAVARRGSNGKLNNVYTENCSTNLLFIGADKYRVHSIPARKYGIILSHRFIEIEAGARVVPDMASHTGT